MEGHAVAQCGWPIFPASDLTYAFLSSGLLEDAASLDRHQRLSDIVHAALC